MLASSVGPAGSSNARLGDPAGRAEKYSSREIQHLEWGQLQLGLLHKTAS